MTPTLVSELKIQPDGKILISGRFKEFFGDKNARIDSNGKIDTTFNFFIDIVSSIFTLNLQPDGKILIGENFKRYANENRQNVARINSDGSLDYTFDPHLGIAKKNNNKIYHL